MNVCIYKYCLYLYSKLHIQCIHWLRARAQWHRWQEETVLVNYEMEWTVRYFLKEADTWKSWSLNIQQSLGAIAYAARQSAVWYGRAATAERCFTSVNSSHVSLVM